MKIWIHYQLNFILIFLSIFTLSGCGPDSSTDNTTNTSATSSFALPQSITQSKLADTGTIRAYISVDNGTRVEMAVSNDGTSAEFEFTALSPGSHQFTITIEYTSNTAPNNPIVLAETTKTTNISAGNTSSLSFADSDYNFNAEDADGDGVGNLYEVLTDNANLKSIQLSNGNLNETFQPGLTSYTATVNYSVNSIQITANTQNDNATLTVNGINTSNEAASHSIDLVEGSNTISIEVTSVDSSIIQSYSLDLIRQSPTADNANLKSIQLNVGELDQIFKPSTLEYTATMSYQTSSIIITANTENKSASFTINGVNVSNGTASDVIELSEGSNMITIQVTSMDSTNTQTYNLDINLESPAADNANLSEIQLTSGNLDQIFQPSQTEYTSTVDYLINSIQIIATAENKNSTISINGVSTINGTKSDSIFLVEGSSAISIEVISEDGSKTLNYSINFTREGLNIFAQNAFLKASNTDAEDSFKTVALSGNTLIVSADNENGSETGVNGNDLDNAASNSGAVYVFTINDGIWTQQAYIKPSNTQSNDFFGSSIAINGDTIAVGAWGEDSNFTSVSNDGSGETDNSSTDAGAVYVFTRTNNVWSQQAYLKASNSNAGDRFGYSVAISDNSIAVGARNEDSFGIGIDSIYQGDNTDTDSGAVYIFTQQEEIWKQQSYIKASNTSANDAFGYSVALTNDILVVGAPNESSNSTGIDGSGFDNSASAAGAVYVFIRGSGGGWSQQAYIKASNTEGGDWFGESVSVFNNTLVVGSIFEDSQGKGVNSSLQSDNVATFSGAVYVFTRNQAGWTQQAYIKASNTESADFFGDSVTIYENILAVGARGEDSNSTDINNGLENDNNASSSGAAYIFSRDSSNVWSQKAYIKASNTDASDSFGRSIAVFNGILAVGASGESSSFTGISTDSNGESDNISIRAGAVYIFK